MPTLYQRIIALDNEPAISLAHYIETDINTDSKTKKTLLSALSALIDADIRAAIISEAVEEARSYNVNNVGNANYTILDNDGYNEIWVNPSSGHRIVTLPDPTLAINLYRKIKIMHIGDGSYKIIIAPNDSEVLYNQSKSFSTLEIFLSYASIEVIGDGTNWIKINSPYLHMLDEAYRNSSYDINVNPTTGWTEANLSSAVPVGTLGLHGYTFILATDSPGTLEIRDGTSSEINSFRVESLRSSPAGSNHGMPATIKAKNGIFDYREAASSAEITTFRFNIWGWLL